jgi:hypothetical protein
MLNSILAICRAVFLILGGHKQVALENIALRQQLGIFQRSVRRPKIRPLDRLFWVCLRKVWKEWKSALEFVQPETVVDWQARRFKILVQVVPTQESRSASNRRRHPKTGEDDGGSQCGLGCTAHPWRTIEAGNRGFRAYGFPAYAETEDQPVPNVANVSR